MGMQTRLSKVEARLAQTKGLLHVADEKAKVAKEWAMSTTIWVVEVNKESEDFKNDVAEARADAYLIKFTNCKDEIAQAYPELDLSDILEDKAMLVVGGEEGVAFGNVGAEEIVAGGPKPEVTTYEGLKNQLPCLRRTLRDFSSSSYIVLSSLDFQFELFLKFNY